MKMLISNERLREKISDDADLECEAGTLHFEAPKPTPDQVEYLRKIQAAVTDYNPDYVVRGRRPEDCK